MTRVYLKDLEPAEVIDRLHEGQIVYYTDTKGKRFQYQMYRGVLWRYNRDTHEVDGYNRSIYSTGECYFEEGTKCIKLEPHRTYKTRMGNLAITTDKNDIWMYGYIIRDNEPHVASWTIEDGLFYGKGTSDPRDIVEELD